jgi:hypothetical protein
MSDLLTSKKIEFFEKHYGDFKTYLDSDLLEIRRHHLEDLGLIP